jgi:hypothetical protein
MEFIPMILCSATVFLDLIDEVTHPFHLHPLYALPNEVHYKPTDLCKMFLFDDIPIYNFASEAHCAILDGGYFIAWLSLFYITIILFYVLCQGLI